MNTQFNTLFTVTPSHAYYSGQCDDIRFVVPSDTTQLLKNGKLLAKTLDGKMYVLFEATDAGTALASIPGRVLRIGLQLTNPFFSNFTDVGTDLASTILLYQNAAVPAALDAPIKVALVGQVFSHTLTDTPRPVTVELKNAAGQVIRTDTVTVADNRTAVSYDLSGQASGAYTIEETYPSSTRQITYYGDPELAAAGVFGVLEVKIANSFYTAMADFQIAFAARQDILKYYVVANNYANNEFDQLSVLDAGFQEDGRLQINFTKVSSTSFTPEEIPPELLGNSSAKVVLFKSQNPVARAEKGRKKIQLKKNNDVLITHLPQPGAEKTNADLIVSVSKP
jgi:hypothetical protein